MGAKCDFHVCAESYYQHRSHWGLLGRGIYGARFSNTGSPKGLGFCFWAPKMTSFCYDLEKSLKSIWDGPTAPTSCPNTLGGLLQLM